MNFFFVSQSDQERENTQRKLQAPDDGNHVRILDLRKDDLIVQYNSRRVSKSITGIARATSDPYVSNGIIYVNVEIFAFAKHLEKTLWAQKMRIKQGKSSPVTENLRIDSKYLAEINRACLDLVLEQAGMRSENKQVVEQVRNILSQGNGESLTITESREPNSREDELTGLRGKEKFMQKILFGAPGTGKSFKIDNPVNGYGLKDVDDSRKFRTTFHPDYDYAQFVGAYKPKKIQNNDNGLLSEEQLAQKLSEFFSKHGNKENVKTMTLASFALQYVNSLNGKNMSEIARLSGIGDSNYVSATLSAVVKARSQLPNIENEISYSFAPQVFAKAYAKAWKLFIGAGSKSTSENQVYLIIEEINRGNCAQIFGDIFQLLDRDDNGFSDYSIDVDCDFADWLKTDEKDGLKTDWEQYIKFHYEKEGKTINPVSETKIALPPNLNILATMNTSDQSLFPMDSAFKRRFDWEYVPINYEHPDAGFDIKIDGKLYKWLEFLKVVNKNVYDVTKSEDKQMGEFFIKHSVDYKEFRSKVLFYLWDSVYKDEIDNRDATVFQIETGKFITFQSLFEGDEETQKNLIKKILSNLEIAEREEVNPAQ